MGLGIGMGMNHWEWEGMGLKKIFPLISNGNVGLHSRASVLFYKVSVYCSSRDRLKRVQYAANARYSYRNRQSPSLSSKLFGR